MLSKLIVVGLLFGAGTAEAHVPKHHAHHRMHVSHHRQPHIVIKYELINGHYIKVRYRAVWVRGHYNNHNKWVHSHWKQMNLLPRR